MNLIIKLFLKLQFLFLFPLIPVYNLGAGLKLSRQVSSSFFSWCISLGHNTTTDSVDACKSRLCTGHASLDFTPLASCPAVIYILLGVTCGCDNMGTSGRLSGQPICVVDLLFYAFFGLKAIRHLFAENCKSNKLFLARELLHFHKY